MKKLYLLFLMVVLTKSSYAQRNIEEALEAFRIALVEANVQALNRLTHDSLSYGHSSGLVENKPAFIEKLQTGRSDFVRIDISNQLVRRHKKTAIVRHTLYAETNDNGQAGTIKLHILQVWMRWGKYWKLLARQSVRAL